MRNETLALHAGFDMDPTTHALAVPIYQTAAYGFDSAEHAAALFNLESRGGIATAASATRPTPSWKRGWRHWKGGAGALVVSSGQTAIYYAMSNLGGSPAPISSSVPQLYGTTHSMFAHFLPNQGITVRFAESDSPADIARLIDADTRGVYCESVGNPAGNISDIAGLAEVAHAHGVPLVVDNTVATPILFRPFAHGADIVVHSLTKFLGGHGTTIGGAIVDAGSFPWGRTSRPLSDVLQARRVLSRPGLH